MSTKKFALSINFPSVPINGIRVGVKLLTVTLVAVILPPTTNPAPIPTPPTTCNAPELVDIATVSPVSVNVFWNVGVPVEP